MPLDPSTIRGALVRMGCDNLEPTLSWLVQTIGLRVDAIFPADSPRTALLSGFGLGIELVCDEAPGARSISLLCDDPDAVAGGQRLLTAPNGATLRLIHADPPMRVPATEQSLVIGKAGADAHWSVGRAGLRYRDLLPLRHGGAFIASHIRILEGGPVPDYVHFHKVRFQMIYCRAGWVRVVYQGQGEPFVMQAGDCVLQPPTIRHRVLESSAGAEVVEFGGPAEHITMADHTMTLPNERLPADHDFHGQRFVRHIAAEARWLPWRVDGFEMRDTGIGAATHGLAGARVVRPVGTQVPLAQRHATELSFYFVLAGALSLALDGGRHAMQRDDSFAIPDGMAYRLDDCTPDLELLEITLPADFETLTA